MQKIRRNHVNKPMEKFLIILFLVFQSGNILASEPELLSKESKIYKEVMPIVIGLKDALINKKINLLIQYSNPDPLYSYAEYLKDVKSEEYKYLYDDSWRKISNPKQHSVYKILSTAKQLKIVLEEYKLKGKIYVRAYYYDEAKIKLKTPLSDKQVNLWGVDFVTCRFVKTEKGWKVAFSIFDYGTDDILNLER